MRRNCILIIRFSYKDMHYLSFCCLYYVCVCITLPFGENKDFFTNKMMMMMITNNQGYVFASVYLLAGLSVWLSARLLKNVMDEFL